MVKFAASPGRHIQFFFIMSASIIFRFTEVTISKLSNLNFTPGPISKNFLTVLFRVAFLQWAFFLKNSAIVNCSQHLAVSKNAVSSHPSSPCGIVQFKFQKTRSAALSL